MAKNEEFETSTGKGGETHQHVPRKGSHSTKDVHLTTNQGIRVSDNQNALRAGARGPTLLKDFVLREKIFHFDHERIPERTVHARGSAAPNRGNHNRDPAPLRRLPSHNNLDECSCRDRDRSSNVGVRVGLGLRFGRSLFVVHIAEGETITPMLLAT